MRKALEFRAANHVSDAFLGQEGENRFPHRRAVDRVAGADAGNHANRSSRLDLVEVDNVSLLKNTEMRRFLGFHHQFAQMWLGAIAQIVLLDGPVAKVEKPQTKSKLAIYGTLHHVVTL